MRKPTEMELRVADALIKASYAAIGAVLRNEDRAATIALVLPQARAAIGAMRKPTQKMLSAIKRALNAYPKPTPGDQRTYLSPKMKGLLRYQAMIDVASPPE